MRAVKAKHKRLLMHFKLMENNENIFITWEMSYERTKITQRERCVRELLMETH